MVVAVPVTIIQVRIPSPFKNSVVLVPDGGASSLGQYVPQREEQDGGTGHKNENEKEQATFAGRKPHRVKGRDVVVEKGGEKNPHGKQYEQDRGSNEKNGTGGFGHLCLCCYL